MPIRTITHQTHTILVDHLIYSYEPFPQEQLTTFFLEGDDEKKFRMLFFHNIVSIRTSHGVQFLSQYKLNSLIWLYISTAVINDNLMDALIKKSSLQVLCLSDCMINDNGLKFLANHPTLKILEIKFSSSLTNIDSLMSIPHLTVLNLPWCKLTTPAVLTIKNLSSLSHLNLQGNPIGSEAAQMLTTHENLRYLNLRDTNLNDESAKNLLKNNSLIYLNLSCNKLTDAAISLDLSNNTTLQYLYLNANYITAKGAVFLTKIPLLHTLNVSFTRLGNDGALILAKATHFKELELADTDIDSAEVASEFAKREKLIFLNLSSNCLDDNCIINLAASSSIIGLNVACNPFSNQGAIALAKNTKLTVLDIYNKNIDEEGLEPFLKNKSLRNITFRSECVKPALYEELSSYINHRRDYRAQFLKIIMTLIYRPKNINPTETPWYILPLEIKTRILSEVEFEPYQSNRLSSTDIINWCLNIHDSFDNYSYHDKNTCSSNNSDSTEINFLDVGCRITAEQFIKSPFFTFPNAKRKECPSSKALEHPNKQLRN